MKRWKGRNNECVRPSSAFTLIELLVVISIVGILAALTLSTISRMRESANTTTCSNHLRQIFIAFQAYTAEHDNTLPQRLYDNDFGYDEALRPYSGGDTRIFLCPSQKKVNYPHQPGYGMNWYYDNQSLTKVDLPSQTILVTDSLGTGEGSHRADRDGIAPGQLDSARHRGKANYLFFDGHIASLTYAETRLPITTPPAPAKPIDMWGADWGDHKQSSPP